MTDLIAFFGARLGEDRREAEAAVAEDSSGDAPWMAQRLLREVQAKRAILPHVVIDGHALDHCDRCMVLRHLNAIYDDHPEYDPAWRP